MKKLKLILCLLVLTAQSLIAQDGYPKRILLDNDTVVAYTPEQVTLINYNKDSFDECALERESLHRELQAMSEFRDNAKISEMKCKEALDKSRVIVKEYDIQIDALEDNQRILKAQVKRAKVMKYIYGGVGLVGGFYLGNKASVLIKL